MTQILQEKADSKKQTTYQWRKENLEKWKEICKRSYEKNKHKYILTRKKYYNKNRKLVLQGKKKYYTENLENILIYNRKLRISKRSKFQEQANAYKLKKGCIDCGYKTHAVALHFDHVTGEKIKNVANYDDWELASLEVAKCVIRCANCHSIKTYENKQFRRRRKTLG